MKKKVMSLLIALVMVAGLVAVPAETANAASNKGVVVVANFKDNVTWETADWEKNRVGVNPWSPLEKVTISKDMTVSFTAYVSKAIFNKSTKDSEHVLSVCVEGNLHDENWNWIGDLRQYDNIDIFVTSEGVSLHCGDFKGGDADVSSFADIDEEGDYYVLTVDGFPLGDSCFSDWNDEGPIRTPIDFSKTYNLGGGLSFTPANGVGGDGVIIVDDYVVKDAGNVIWKCDFESDENCANKYAPGDDMENHPEIKGVAYTTKLLSLKANKANIKVGKKAKIKATAVKGAKVTYKSNKPKVASVDAKGNVKGLKKGKAVISVTCCGKTLKYTVTVK